MKETRVELTINAPRETVFDVIADCAVYSKAVPNIVDVEMLSEVARGVGTRFKETRVMKGRESKVELEVTEFIKNERIRFISDEGGVVWDTVFSLTEEAGKTHLVLLMQAKPYKFLAKMMVPLIGGMVYKAIESDMQSVREFCERQR